MTNKNIDIRDLELLQDEVGAWYYQLNGLPYTGCALQYYVNGRKAAETNLVKGYQEGVERIWYQNGQLKSENNFKNNIFHGICKSWNEQGILLFEGEYDMGIRVWSKRYNDLKDLLKE